MSDLYNVCACGRRISVNRDICINCQNLIDGVEDEFEDPIEQFKADAKKIVEESRDIAKAQGYGKVDAVSPEECARRGREIDPVFAVMEAPYLNAVSYKWHDTRYRDADPFAFCALAELKKRARDLTREEREQWNNAPNTGKYKGMHDAVVSKECASYNRAYAQALEGEDTWFRLQRLIEEDKLSIQDEYSIQLALKKSTALVGYTVEDGEVSIDINGLAMTADEARDRSGTKNHAHRQFITVGYETLKDVSDKVGEYTTIEDILNYLDEADFGVQVPVRVKVTNIGTNPYTHEQVRTPSRPIDYDIIRVDGRVIEDALKPLREFYSQFDMHKHNYVGTVNKKSDGRCSRTGCYPDPKSEDMMQLYRHTPSIIITPNVKIQETSHTVQFKQLGALQEEREISKVTRGEDCECGCNVKVKDMRRGEVICPKCGLVFHRDTIVG